MKEQFKICDITINYCREYEDSHINEDLLLFKSNSHTNDMEFVLRKVNSIDYPKECLNMDSFFYSYSCSNKGNYFWNNRWKHAIMKSSADWSKSTIYTTEKMDDIVEGNFLLSAVQSRLSYLNGFMMHGSVVGYKGYGIVFTAGCGVGKSTQANLWAEHEGAEIINGDKAFIRHYQEETKVYGSIWSGSSPYVKNIDVPLKAIVVLEQGKENKIRKLSELEAIELFGTHVYYPYWEKKLVSLVLDTVGLIIKDIPIYLLSCKPDKDAVNLVKETLFS